jgi:hypothetical protein
LKVCLTLVILAVGSDRVCWQSGLRLRLRTERQSWL